MGLSELWAELASLSVKQNFYLKEQLPEKLWLFGLGYFADIKKKTSREKLPVFSANKKI